MNKRLILLILILPILLMFTLYSAVNTVSIEVKVPVSKIEIRGERFVTLNLDKNERYYVDYVIYPTTAKNKQINFSVEPIANQPMASIDYKDGYIYPKSAGAANVCLTTFDGGFKAKFQVIVKSNILQEIKCTVDKEVLIVNETTQITTQFMPNNVNDKSLEYISSNLSVVEIDNKGLINAKGKGQATVTVRSKLNPIVYDTIDILVNADKLLTTENEITILKQSGVINLTVDTVEDYSVNYQILDENGQELINVLKPIRQDVPFIDEGNGNYKFEFTFNDENFYGVAVVNFTLTTPTQTVSQSCKINRIKDFIATFNFDGDLYVELDSILNWEDYIIVSPSDAEYEISVSYSNDNLSSIYTMFTANKIGVTNANITVTNKNDKTQVANLQKIIYACPTDLFINESIKEDGTTYGIEDVWTIGKHTVSGKPHKLTLSFGGATLGDGVDKVKEKVYFDCNNSNSVSVNQNGEINILEDDFNDIIEIKAKVNLTTQKTIESQPFNVRCVGSGYEVDNFIDLYNFTKDNKIVILQNDVIDDFGKNNDGTNFYLDSNKNYVGDKIKSTYDTKFYGQDTPEVITLLQFRNDLYGNGYIINANNVTNVERTVGLEHNPNAIFNGPLNFVAMGNLASVKAQDNICFAVFENVKINNVQLIGRTLDDSQGSYDLTDLNYAGTVVEVLGDNVTVEYCRISNGRTVLRAFGDYANEDKTINVTIKNSILSRAREFIVRMGSNKIVYDERDVSKIDVNNYDAPSLDDSENFNYPTIIDYSSFTDAEKQDYESKYIKTFVTIENSVLEDSGLFCIGLDTHFAGPMLLDAKGAYGYSDSAFSSWKGLSGTSYGSKLTLNGDVRMYNWKPIENFDSSTLIETSVELDENLDLKFDIKEMITKLSDTSMVYAYGGQQYVHGGITLFGGGKNYSVVKNNCTTITGLEDEVDKLSLSEYQISLKDVDKDILEQAAGNKPFYFMIFGADSQFTPRRQDEILNSDKAYNCIFING